MDFGTLVTILLLAVLPGFIVGLYVGWHQANQRHLKQDSEEREAADAQMMELQQQQRDALREAKEETAKIRQSLEAEARERRAEMKSQEQRLRQKEETLDRKTESIEKRERTLTERQQEFDAQKIHLDEMHAQWVAELERVGRMSQQ